MVVGLRLMSVEVWPRFTRLLSPRPFHRQIGQQAVHASGALFDTGHSEADVAENLIAGLGFDPARIAFERATRNIRENALLAMALAQPQAGETWLLVTSAFHMPRAMGSFGRAGWQVTP